MALTTPRGFSGGPMADIDYGMVSARSCWVEESQHLAVTQPSTGTRSVSIAAGLAGGWGIRVLNDAALSQVIGAPGSGGAWYMLVIRRDWSAKSATLQVLAGPTTGGTTTPTTVPNTLPATFTNTPGTQVDQPLAWVFSSSATTTLTLFDLRVQDTRARGLQVPNLHALAVLSLTMLAAGSGITPKVIVGPHTLGSEQLQAIEAVGNAYGAFVLTGRVFTNSSTSIGGMGAALKALLVAYSGLIYGEATSQGRAGLLLLDTYVNGNPDYTWNGADWELTGCYVEVGAAFINGGIVLSGSNANWTPGQIDTRAQRFGKMVWLELGINVAASTPAGTVLAVLPLGIRPQRTVSFVATMFDSGNFGWGGIVINCTVEANGNVIYQGASNINGYTIAAGKGVFATTTFRAA